VAPEVGVATQVELDWFAVEQSADGVTGHRGRAPQKRRGSATPEGVFFGARCRTRQHQGASCVSAATYSG
jgi:hypothetical protein